MSARHSRTYFSAPKGMVAHRLQFLNSSEHDQELDSLLVGPVPPGINKFVFEADPPNTANIPSSEVIGVTVILLTCAYDGREFVRIGYYVNNEYADESLAENPPAKPVIEKIKRNILAEKPRVTRFAIKWYVSISYKMESYANNGSGIPKPPLPPNSHLINPRPTSSQTMRLPMAPKRLNLRPLSSKLRVKLKSRPNPRLREKSKWAA
jgi:hypothetical protein